MPAAQAPNIRAIAKPYAASAVAVALACALGLALDAWIAPPNISMVFLLAVLYAAIRHGLGPSLFASLLGTLLYNLLFLEPRYSLAVDNPANIVALVFLLIVAVLTSEIAARMKRQNAAAKAHAAANAALHEFSGKIAGIGRLDDLVWAAAHQIATMLAARVVILLPSTAGKLEIAGGYPPEDRLGAADLALATQAWLDGRPTGRDTAFEDSSAWRFAPMKLAHGPVGAIGIGRAPQQGPAFSDSDRRLIDALADQIAVAIERVQLAQEMETARLAAESEKLRVALLGAISHDFRTPLASIIGSASSLRSLWQRFDEPTRTELLDTIRNEGERLNRFVGNVLEMTRLEAGKLSVTRQPADLADIVATTLAEMAPVLVRHRIALRAAEDLPLADLDPVLCRQVFVNLLDNAAKFAPADSAIAIDVRAEGGKVVAEIADEGPGIAPENLPAIFDRFFRVSSGDRRRAGSGLGLAICRGLVEAMHGTIAARNRTDRAGAIFAVAFPAAALRPLDME